MRVFIPWVFGLLLAITLSALLFFARDLVHKRIVGGFHPDILMLGDSNTEGGGIWDFRLRTFMRAVNFGEGGAGIRVIDWRARVRSFEVHDFKTVVIMAGTNDYDGKPLSFAGDAEAAAQTYIELLRYFQARGVAKIIVTSTPPRASAPHNAFYRALNAKIQQFAGISQCCVYIDLWPALADGDSVRADMTTDGVHFSEKAYKIWAAELRKHID